MNKNLEDLALEMNGISMIVTGLSVTLDDEGNTPTMSTLQDALFAISRHLDRIVCDVYEINGQMIKNSDEKGAKA